MKPITPAPASRIVADDGTILDHFCGDEIEPNGKCGICGGPDPR